MTSRRWLVVGTGGVGGYFGGLLADNGLDVTFLARGDHLSAMQTAGLRVETVKGDFLVEQPQVVESLDGSEPFDAVLFCVKAYDNVSAAKTIEKAADSRTAILSIQNGLGNDVELRRLLPQTQVYPGLANIISARVSPGVIRQSGGMCTAVFGDPVDPGNVLLQEIAAEMRMADVNATASQRIERDQWDKFLFLIGFSGLTALCRAPIGDILNDAGGFDLYRRCVSEAIVVAQADGVDLDPNAFDKTMKRIQPYFDEQAAATSSLARDVLDGKRTEIETLSGAIVRRAERHGIDVPVNATIYSAIRIGTRRQFLP